MVIQIYDYVLIYTYPKSITSMVYLFIITIHTFTPP